MKVFTAIRQTFSHLTKSKKKRRKEMEGGERQKERESQ